MLKLIIPFLFITTSLAVNGQSMNNLEAKVLALNDQAKYDESLQLLFELKDSKKTSYKDKVTILIYISQTYKRLFDYDKVFQTLDEAKRLYSRKKIQNKKLNARIKLEYALAYFDIKEHEQSKKIMDDLRKEGFNDLDGANQAYIYMQEGYIAYLAKDYHTAEKLLDQSIEKMLRYSPRNLPIVYGKKIRLYAAQNKRKLMYDNFANAMKYANQFKLLKYKMYACQMMRKGMKEVGDFKEAYRYCRLEDSYESKYNAEDFHKSLSELEVKYETDKKEKELKIKKADIKGQNRLIAFLFTLLVLLFCSVLLIQNAQRRKILLKEKLATRRFAKALIENVEDERRRISGDLHDSVNNELLLIRSSIEKDQQVSSNRIDKLIDNIRVISRNLHPVMFEELGLENSVEQLVYQVQEYNQFILNAEISYNNGLDTKEALQVFRIIQEATNNIIKYSKAVAALIRIEESEKNVIIEIKDNGVGFDVRKQLSTGKSLGLLSMTERTELMNGTIKFQSTNKGTLIQLTIPKKLQS